MPNIAPTGHQGRDEGLPITAGDAWAAPREQYDEDGHHDQVGLYAEHQPATVEGVRQDAGDPDG